MLAVVGKDLAQDTALMPIIMFSFQEDPAGGFSYDTVYVRGTEREFLDMLLWPAI